MIYHMTDNHNPVNIPGYHMPMRNNFRSTMSHLPSVTLPLKVLKANLSTLKIKLHYSVLFPHIFEHRALPVNAVISHNVSLSGKSPG